MPFGQQIFEEGMYGITRVILSIQRNCWRDGTRAAQVQPRIVVDKPQRPLVEQAADFAVRLI
ncbi:hypothetical protein D3C87_1959980 [compost metagenome]